MERELKQKDQKVESTHPFIPLTGSDQHAVSEEMDMKTDTAKRCW